MRWKLQRSQKQASLRNGSASGWHQFYMILTPMRYDMYWYVHIYVLWPESNPTFLHIFAFRDMLCSNDYGCKFMDFMYYKFKNSLIFHPQTWEHYNVVPIIYPWCFFSVFGTSPIKRRLFETRVLSQKPTVFSEVRRQKFPNDKDRPWRDDCFFSGCWCLVMMSTWACKGFAMLALFVCNLCVAIISQWRANDANMFFCLALGMVCGFARNLHSLVPKKKFIPVRRRARFFRSAVRINLAPVIPKCPLDDKGLWAKLVWMAWQRGACCHDRRHFASPGERTFLSRDWWLVVFLFWVVSFSR